MMKKPSNPSPSIPAKAALTPCGRCWNISHLPKITARGILFRQHRAPSHQFAKLVAISTDFLLIPGLRCIDRYLSAPHRPCRQFERQKSLTQDKCRNSASPMTSGFCLRLLTCRAIGLFRPGCSRRSSTSSVNNAPRMGDSAVTCLRYIFPLWKIESDQISRQKWQPDQVRIRRFIPEEMRNGYDSCRGGRKNSACERQAPQNGIFIVMADGNGNKFSTPFIISSNFSGVTDRSKRAAGIHHPIGHTEKNSR